MIENIISIIFTILSFVKYFFYFPAFFVTFIHIILIHFLSTLRSPSLCGFLSLTIFIHFFIHMVIHISTDKCGYPQNVDNLWITFPIYSHSFITFSKKSLFFNGFRLVGSVFNVIHISHILHFPL